MAEANSEIEIINHLLEVEKNASILLDDARKEAERRIINAKNKANEEFQKEYENLVASAEADYNRKLKEIDSNHDNVISEYKESLCKKSIDKENFFKYVDSLLF